MDRRQFLGCVASLPAIAAISHTAVANTIEKKYLTGLPLLDKQLGGGLRGGTLAIVLGGSGVGLTSFCDQLSLHNAPRILNLEGTGSFDWVSLQEGKSLGCFDTIKPHDIEVFAACFRRQAFERNHANILSLHIHKGGLHTSFDWHYGDMQIKRMADYIFHIQNVKGGRKIIMIIKNRYQRTLNQGVEAWLGVGGFQELGLVDVNRSEIVESIF